jgi:hypothetical protein
MKGKTATTRSPKTVNKSGTKTTTRTADGGQQYMRDTKKPFSASDQYGKSAMGRKPKTLNPKIAEDLGRASGYAIDPKASRLASNLANIERGHAEKMNQTTRDYGNKKGRR